MAIHIAISLSVKSSQVPGSDCEVGAVRLALTAVHEYFPLASPEVHCQQRHRSAVELRANDQVLQACSVAQLPPCKVLQGITPSQQGEVMCAQVEAHVLVREGQPAAHDVIIGDEGRKSAIELLGLA